MRVYMRHNTLVEEIFEAYEKNDNQSKRGN